MHCRNWWKNCNLSIDDVMYVIRDVDIVYRIMSQMYTVRKYYLCNLLFVSILCFFCGLGLSDKVATKSKSI